MVSHALACEEIAAGVYRLGLRPDKFLSLTKRIGSSRLEIDIDTIRDGDESSEEEYEERWS